MIYGYPVCNKLFKVFVNCFILSIKLIYSFDIFFLSAFSPSFSSFNFPELLNESKILFLNSSDFFTSIISSFSLSSIFCLYVILKEISLLISLKKLFSRLILSFYFGKFLNDLPHFPLNLSS